MTEIAFEERTWDFGRCAEAPEGPWKFEPDKVQWVDPATGLDCLILRNRSGGLCGYVGMPQGHPWFGKDYDEVHSMADVEIHGGLTFASFCHEGRGDDAVCHVPFPGRDGHVWWLGFDCAHCGDLLPNHIRLFEDLDLGKPRTLGFQETYKDIAYVKGEVISLARQAKEIMDGVKA